MTERQRAAGIKNMKKGKAICESVAREYQKKSVESRLANKKEELIIKKELAKKLGADDLDEILGNLIARAKDNSRDFEVLQAALGQKPTDKQEVTANVSMTVEDYFNQIDDGWDEA